jgi:hypothetical protein
VLDGELVVPVDGELSFGHLLMRLAQSAARAKKLAAEYPAGMFVFDNAGRGARVACRGDTDRGARKEGGFVAKHLDDNGLCASRPQPLTSPWPAGGWPWPAARWMVLSPGGSNLPCHAFLT